MLVNCAPSWTFTHSKSAWSTGSTPDPLNLKWVQLWGCYQGNEGAQRVGLIHAGYLLSLYLSARARASGSVGGIMKQTAGAVSVFPALSVRSQLSPLFLCRV